MIVDTVGLAVSPRVRCRSSVFLLLGPILLLGGCGANAKWTYPSGIYESSRSSRPGPAIVAVEPFEDVRDPDNSNLLMIALIPIVPVGISTYERVEAARQFVTLAEYTATPSEDLSKAVAAELLRENLVQRAFFTYGGGDADVATHVLRGRIHVFRYEGSMITYGLSVFGAYLWILGLPVGSSANELDIELELVDKATNTPVWRHRIRERDSVVQGLYYNTGRDCDAFAALFERGLREALVGMAPVIGAEPAPLPARLLEELSEHEETGQ